MLVSCGKMSTFALELWAIKRNVSLFFCNTFQDNLLRTIGEHVLQPAASKGRLQ